LWKNPLFVVGDLAMKTKYPEPKYGRTKIGRCRYVNDSNRKPIIDLSWNPANGIYYYTKVAKVKFGVKYTSAVFAFKKFISGNKKTTPLVIFDKDAGTELKTTTVHEDTIVYPPDDGKHVMYGVGKRVHNQTVLHIPDEVKMEIFKDMFDTYTLSELALISGIDELAQLKHITPLPKSYTLDNIFNVYLDRPDNPITLPNKTETILFWNEFKRSVQNTFIRNIGVEDIDRYERKILREWKENSPTQSPRYLLNRINKIRGMLSYCMATKTISANKHHKNDFKTLLELCEFLNIKEVIKRKVKTTKKSKKKALKKGGEIMTPEIFRKLYECADDKMKLALLFGANFGYTFIDCQEHEIYDIDLQSRTLDTYRLVQ